MESVLVLLSTYNGQKYLREQLDSLYVQEGVNINILARDDGSKDDTIAILYEYQHKFGKMNIIEGSNIGCARSFCMLINEAATKYDVYDYYAFCDQDDVWLPNKLYVAASSMNKLPKANRLYFSAANYVDANMRFLGKKNSPNYFDYKTCVFRNPALGCTMVYDGAFLRLINTDYGKRIEDENPLQLHDVWAFICANYLGTQILCDNKSFINYRQWGGNVTNAKKSFFNKYLSAIKRVRKESNWRQNQTRIFLHIFRDQIPEEKRFFLECLCDYDRNIHCLIKYLRIQPWKGESLIDKVLWTILVLAMKF